MRNLLLAATLLAPLAAGAETLTIGFGGSITSADPHFYNAAPNNTLASHIFDRLIERDSHTRPFPSLATSMTALSETLWEVKLRPGVKWHDGREFTADDVAFTIARVPNVPNSPASFAGFVRTIAKVEVVDPLTLHLHTAQVDPLLPVQLASIIIVSRHAGEGATTEDYNSGKAAIGTGAYRLTSYMPGNRVELARNDAWHRDRPEWERVSFRFIGNGGARTAALLAGDVDMIDQVPTGDIPRLRNEPEVTLAQIQGLRVIYLSPDRSRTDNPAFVFDNSGKPLAQNPFNDLRVRRALSLAISRDVLAERVMEGSGTPAAQWLPEGVYSYNPEVTPPQQDIEGAKRLLAEAGFPQGFRLTLHSPNDRYPNDSKTAQAVAQMWTRAGVRTEVEALPWSSFSSRAARQEFGMRLVGWGTSSGEASYGLVHLMNTYDRGKGLGGSNSARYSNPALDALTAQATTTIDDEKREEILREAVKVAMDDVAIMPLFFLTNTWALRKGLTYDARMDESTRAMGVRQAQ